MSVSALTTSSPIPRQNRLTKIAYSSLTPFQQRAIREIYRFRHAPTGQGRFITKDPLKVKVKRSYRTGILAIMQTVALNINCAPNIKGFLNRLVFEQTQKSLMVEDELERTVMMTISEMIKNRPQIDWMQISSVHCSDQAILQELYSTLKPTEDLTLAYLAKLDVTIDRFLAFFELPPDMA